MKITAQTSLQFEISEEQRKKIALDYLYELCDWTQNTYLNRSTQKVMETKKYHTTHSWDEQIELRHATALDIAIANILEGITFKSKEH